MNVLWMCYECVREREREREREIRTNTHIPTYTHRDPVAEEFVVFEFVHCIVVEG